MVRLAGHYKTKVVDELKQQFGYKNPHQIPKLDRIVLNMGIGREAVTNSKAVEGAAADMAQLSGQKASVRRSRKSIANFKLRQGLPIGVTVTLRRDRMWFFLEKLINIALPRVRDFRGLSGNAFDGSGNYSIGLGEQLIFPEINIEKSQVRGMNVTFVTTANTDAEGKALLKGLGLPFRN